MILANLATNLEYTVAILYQEADSLVSKLINLDQCTFQEHQVVLGLQYNILSKSSHPKFANFHYKSSEL